MLPCVHAGLVRVERTRIPCRYVLISGASSCVILAVVESVCGRVDDFVTFIEADLVQRLICRTLDIIKFFKSFEVLMFSIGWN